VLFPLIKGSYCDGNAFVRIWKTWLFFEWRSTTKKIQNAHPQSEERERGRGEGVGTLALE